MSDNENIGCTVGPSVGIGSVIAALLSWVTWHSIPWAIIHGLLGWLFIIYWAVAIW